MKRPNPAIDSDTGNCHGVRSCASLRALGRISQPPRMPRLLFLAIALLLMEQSTAADGPPSRKVLTCEPRQLGWNDTLVLRFALPHPEELAIRGPDRMVYFLVYEPDASLPPGWKPIVDKVSFKTMSELRLPVATAKGTPWAVGRTENELIFGKPGTYEVVLTDVLESDTARPVFRCRITLPSRK